LGLYLCIAIAVSIYVPLIGRQFVLISVPVRSHFPVCTCPQGSIIDFLESVSYVGKNRKSLNGLGHGGLAVVVRSQGRIAHIPWTLEQAGS
jgi:hypothetical protein